MKLFDQVEPDDSDMEEEVPEGYESEIEEELNTDEDEPDDDSDEDQHPDEYIESSPDDDSDSDTSSKLMPPPPVPKPRKTLMIDSVKNANLMTFSQLDALPRDEVIIKLRNF